MQPHNHWGRLAQLVERLVYTEDVGSSSLSSPTISSDIDKQAVKARETGRISACRLFFAGYSPVCGVLAAGGAGPMGQPLD